MRQRRQGTLQRVARPRAPLSPACPDLPRPALPGPPRLRPRQVQHGDGEPGSAGADEGGHAGEQQLGGVALLPAGRRLRHPLHPRRRGAHGGRQGGGGRGGDSGLAAQGMRSGLGTGRLEAWAAQRCAEQSDPDQACDENSARAARIACLATDPPLFGLALHRRTCWARRPCRCSSRTSPALRSWQRSWSWRCSRRLDPALVPQRPANAAARRRSRLPRWVSCQAAEGCDRQTDLLACLFLSPPCRVVYSLRAEPLATAGHCCLFFSCNRPLLIQILGQAHAV